MTAKLKKTGGLGRGLGSILPDIDIDAARGHTVAAAISQISIDDITANPYQPRKEFDDEALQELAQSIRQQGVITPITVRRMPDDTYQLIAGERRTRAARLAGLKEIPAYVRVATDTQMMEMALVENIQRSDLGAIEVALAYKALIEECRLTHDQLSEKVGKNRSTITNYLRLLNLPAETQLALSEGKISMAHARALLSVEDIDRHLEILHAIIGRHLSVHQTEQMAKEQKRQPVAPVRRRGDLPATHQAAQSRLKDRLQSTVEVKRSQRGKGTLTIHFNSDSDFERILALLDK
ncbi:MAG: ParB/RepB/Spo0J family partition protein [Bacteroidales bacterium]|nr:ParB/RepB/Spo0J family partition protein [Bacteroidales bacterium]